MGNSKVYMNILFDKGELISSSHFNFGNFSNRFLPVAVLALPLHQSSGDYANGTIGNNFT